MSHLPIWYLADLNENEIEKANQEFKLIKTKKATMGIDGEKLNTIGRDTDVAFADINHWFGIKMYNFGLLANKECNWNFDIQEHEAMQYAQYNFKQHYDWHIDTFPLSGKLTDRKVTVVCLMNNSDEFKGGDFKIRLYQEYIAPLKKGTIIAFPSFLEHKVTSITSGIRYSATMWLIGPRFK